MSVTYHKLLRRIAHLVGALKGDAMPGRETSYSAATITMAELSDSAPPLTAMKDALILAEERLALAIARNREASERAFLAGVTSNIANESALPSLDSLSRPIVGVWGGVYDASDGTQLSERALAFVRERAANPGSFFRVASYAYALDGGRIYHTRTNIIIRVCAYDASTQRTAVDANSAMLLPDVLEEALACGGASYLSGEAAFAAQAKDYRAHFEEVVRGYEPAREVTAP